MVKALYDLALRKAVKVGQIADHSGRRINLSTDRDFYGVVMAVSVGVIAFAVEGLVLGVSRISKVQAVRSCIACGCTNRQTSLLTTTVRSSR